MRMKALKCVIFGDSQVGKTSLLIAHTAGGIALRISDVVFDLYSTAVFCTSSESEVKLKIWDTAGNDSSVLQNSRILENTNVFIVCFALNSIESYISAKNKWCPDLRRAVATVPIVLVGTKCDVRCPDEQWVNLVTTEMGEALSKEVQACAYVECSMRKREYLNKVFEAAVQFALPLTNFPSQDDDDADSSTVLSSWLVDCSDLYLMNEALRYDAEKQHLSSRMAAALYLDHQRSRGVDVDSPAAWVIAGTETDKTAFWAATSLHVPYFVLVSKEKTYKALNAKRAAGYEVDVHIPPSWVTDSSTQEMYDAAVARKVSSKVLNSRAETELFLLNIEEGPPSCWSCGLFG